MAPLLRSELFRLVRRWMPRILLLILIGLVGLLYILLWVTVRSGAADEFALRENLRLASVRDTGLNLVFQIGSVNIIIMTASLIGSEYGWGTIRALLPRASSRTAYFSAKLVTALLFVAVTVLIGLVVSFAASAVITAIEGLPSGLGPQGLSRTVFATARTTFVMLPYVALTIMVTTLTRSVAAGIGLGLAVLFLESLFLSLIGLAGGIFERLPGALISRNVQALLEANAAGLEDSFSSSGAAMPSVWQAAVVLAAYTVAFLFLAYRSFIKRDITAGS